MRIRSISDNLGYIADILTRKGNIHNLLNECNQYAVTLVFEDINRFQSMLLCELKYSYTQQSQRYVSANKEASDMHPLEKRMYDLYHEMTELSETYSGTGRPKKTDFKYGIPYEDARYILPIASNTNLIMTFDGGKFFELLNLMFSSEYSFVFGNDFHNELYSISEDMGTILQIYALNQHIFEHNIDTMSFMSVKDNEDYMLPNQKVSFAAAISGSKSFNYDIPKDSPIAQRVIDYGHVSIVEHVEYSFEILLSLCCYHQLIRHRHLKIFRQPLTSVNDFKYYIPESIRINEEYNKKYSDLMNEISDYLTRKSFPDLTMIPNGFTIKARIVANPRGLSNFFKLRLCNNAQTEIRELALYMLAHIPAEERFLFGNFKPDCCYDGCKEKGLSCGNPLKGKI
ncbi:MAG: FAD-dependent thymidylate synthase [Herbinix sp.]|nr:FAD-dependent thymidylate synthase [Herbinix sp.]